MTRYVGPIRRVRAGRGHVYKDANGVRVPGVTTVMGNGLPKKALINWAGNATADYAINHWDELGKMKPAARLAKLQKARYEDRDAAANRGTEVHAWAEKYIAGERVHIPDEIAAHVESYIHFVDEWKPEPVLIEAVVMSHKHGVAGTLDLVADFPAELIARQRCFEHLADLDRPVRALVDLKTSRSGIFGEVALQLAMYRSADVYLDADGVEQPMIPVDIVLALHVRSDGYDLYPIEAGPTQVREWLYAREVAEFAEETSKTYVGEALASPARMKLRRLEVIDTAPGEDPSF